MARFSYKKTPTGIVMVDQRSGRAVGKFPNVASAKSKGFGITSKERKSIHYNKFVNKEQAKSQRSISQDVRAVRNIEQNKYSSLIAGLLLKGVNLWV